MADGEWLMDLIPGVALDLSSELARIERYEFGAEEIAIMGSGPPSSHDTQEACATSGLGSLALING